MSALVCETGNCPECRIQVGVTNVTPIHYHLFIWYTDGDRDIVYRGGPEANSTYATAVQSGLATQYSAPTQEGFDIDWPFDNLVTNRQEGLADNHDYEVWAANGNPAHMVTVAEGPDYCGLDEAFTRETRRIGELGRTYNAIDIDRIDNSNATVYTILQEMGLPLMKPAVSCPGWGTNLHREETLPETIERTFDEATRPARDQMNWFNGLSDLDQYNVLRRLFGGY